MSGQANGFVISQELDHDQRLHRHRHERLRHLVSDSSHITLAGNHVSYAGQPVSGQTKSGIRLNNVTDSLVRATPPITTATHGIYSRPARRATRCAATSLQQRPGIPAGGAGIRLYSSPRATPSPATYARQRGLRHRVLSRFEQHPDLSTTSPTTTATTASTTYPRPGSGSSPTRLQERDRRDQRRGQLDRRTLANNISVDNGINEPRTHSDIRVDIGSTAGHDDGLRPGLPDRRRTRSLIWNSVELHSLAAFQAATGQERTASRPTRVAEPGRRRLPPARRLSRDRLGQLRRDRRAEPRTSTATPGSTTPPRRTPAPARGRYDDRGAYEFRPGGAPPVAALSVTPASGSAPLGDRGRLRLDGRGRDADRDLHLRLRRRLARRRAPVRADGSPYLHRRGTYRHGHRHRHGGAVLDGSHGDGQPGRRPLADQDRHPRSGLRRPAAHLHPDGGPTPGPSQGDRRGASPTTCPRASPTQSAIPSQGSCSQSSHGTVSYKPRDARERQPGDGPSPGHPAVGGQRHEHRPGERRPGRPASANNSASATTTVNPAADLSLTKTDTPDPVFAGQPLTYTLTAANAGPSQATGVSVTDNLPAGVTYQSATPSQGSCSQSSGTVSCSLGTLASGNQATVQVQVTPQSEGNVHEHRPGERRPGRPREREQLGERDDDRQPGRRPLADQDRHPDPVFAGQPLTYTLTAANAGPSQATGVSVTDNLPAGVTYQSATPSQGSCSQSSGTVSCSLGTLASGNRASVQVPVTPQSEGSVTNTAQVSADQADPRARTTRRARRRPSTRPPTSR